MKIVVAAVGKAVPGGWGGPGRGGVRGTGDWTITSGGAVDGMETRGSFETCVLGSYSADVGGVAEVK